MNQNFDPRENYIKTKEAAGYVPRAKATQKTYDEIGFMSGLEVHQQLKTKEKLFCHCPAGVYNKPNVFDAEVIRHMRPTLSELGEYDGTALMEFKTRKNIVYRLKNETTCTYEVDDTPPFPVNREALNIAIEISLLSKLNIVGEVHITRKQYLDGSIPTGFQRTAIIGVEGEIPLKNKKIRLIQLSLEEDSCREVSDIGHTRIYRTDRLGMPLIETVTYPEMVNPDEVKEACDYIRFLNRSTGKVRTGIGAGRQDVNVSCRGGVRVEIKGVAHTRWIPELTHNECFRQWSLLMLRDKLVNEIPDHKDWKITHAQLDYYDFNFSYQPLKDNKDRKNRIIAINLPGFNGALSHFTQPGKMFANELIERLKVIACLEVPNLTHTEEFEPVINAKDWQQIRTILKADSRDAQLVIWGPDDDMKTALETIEERCKMAFAGIPNETRKSFENGTTIFERVLPGADRMYPDTDSAPIPLEDSLIKELGSNLPQEIVDRYNIMKEWGIPEDTYTYIFKKNLFPLIEKIVDELGYDPAFVGKLFGHKLKFVEGHSKPTAEFSYKIIYGLLKFISDNGLTPEVAWLMLPHVYEHPKLDFESVLISIKFKKVAKEQLFGSVPFLKSKFAEIQHTEKVGNEKDWIMGQLRKMAIGNVSLTELAASL
ncbi:MAG: Glu-tRNA(Gln) amidotransferase GatDE subunit E [Bacteroidetes bacterium HGW-Bacteroidetes-11]|jgi:glutamyl-tRNA(Gln) amidotransferase subunit E|nr:MAG: Glu-tRNA(Gln) amidotransferase GatDE subunit E [Bacteroidetes bacterium HGW-Bacteroidetes-11]